MASGALIAAGAAAAAGLGYLWWRSRQQAAAAGGSLCQSACVAAARAAGQVPGSSLDAQCALACDVLPVDKIAGAAKAVVTAVSNALSGKSDPRNNMFDTAAVVGSGAKCPAGSTVRFGSGSMLSDHRTSRDSTTSCVDASGKTIGTLTSDGKFNPYAITEPAPPAPVVPVRMPSNTSTSTTTAPIQPATGYTWDAGGFWRRLRAGETAMPAPGGALPTGSATGDSGGIRVTEGVWDGTGHPSDLDNDSIVTPEEKAAWQALNPGVEFGSAWRF